MLPSPLPSLPSLAQQKLTASLRKLVKCGKIFHLEKSLPNLLNYFPLFKTASTAAGKVRRTGAENSTGAVDGAESSTGAVDVIRRSLQ
jgi:hypothetical protein